MSTTDPGPTSGREEPQPLVTTRVVQPAAAAMRTPCATLPASRV